MGAVMDDQMKAVDSKVAAIAETLKWDPKQWPMARPTYTQTGYRSGVPVDIEVSVSPGAREFHRTDAEGNQDGTSIRVHHFWNGSASFHPEQPTEYPGVTVRVSIPAGRYDLQRKLAERFREVIDEVLHAT